MNERIETSLLRQQAEPLATLSIMHLTPATRQLLSNNDLSVDAYPTANGGFVYVGAPRYDVPLETDLAAVFELAERSGVVWLKFDEQGSVIGDLPVFDNSEEWL